MKNVIIHIGHYKTGSSAIQNYFHSNNSDYDDINYCKTGLCTTEKNVGVRHYFLSKNIRGKDCLWSKLKEEVESSNYQTHLISHEGMLTGIKEDELGYIAHLLSAFNITIICYLRRQDIFFNSWYAEHIQNHKLKIEVPAFLNHFSDFGNYYSQLNKWKKNFPNSTFLVFNYDKISAKNTSIIEHFLLKTVNQTPKGNFVRTDNLSVNGNVAASLLEFNKRQDLPRVIHQKMGLVLNSFLSNNGKTCVMSKKDASALLEKYKHENSCLKKDFGSTFKAFANRSYKPYSFGDGLAGKMLSDVFNLIKEDNILVNKTIREKEETTLSLAGCQSSFQKVTNLIENLSQVDFVNDVLDIEVDKTQNLKDIRFIKIKLQNRNPLHFDYLKIINNKGERLKIFSVTSSSKYNDMDVHDGRNLLTKVDFNGKNCIHTKTEESPWLLIDLGKYENITKIIFYRSSNNHRIRLASLKVEVSGDLESWHSVHDFWVLKQDASLASELDHAFMELNYNNSKPINLLIETYKEKSRAISEKIYELGNKIANKNGVALTSHGLHKNFGLMSEGDRKVYYEELVYILNLLNEFGVLAFPSSGTLLGLVRDGKLIDHDDDLDICYISNFESESEVLAERDKLVSFLVDKGCKLKASKLAHYWCVTPNRVSVDIFTGFFENEFCSMNPIGRKKVFKTDVFPLKTLESQGFIFSIPNNETSVLSLNYGPNWKIKDPLWKFDWTGAMKDFKFLYF